MIVYHFETHSTKKMSCHLRNLHMLLAASATIVVSTAFLLGVAAGTAPAPVPAQLSLPGCQEVCGNVIIPYPFGIKKGCYYSQNDNDTYYELTCDDRYHPARPMYGNIQVLDIDILKGQIRITKIVSYSCYASNGTQILYYNPPLDMGRFTVSSSMNMFVATGCDTYAWFKGMRHGRPYSTGCMTACSNPEDVAEYTCSGLGCCETTIPDDITNINVEPESFDNHTDVSYFNPCSAAFVVAKDAFTFSLANLSRVPHKSHKLPVVFDWMIGTENCSIAKLNGSCLCKANTTVCDDLYLHNGYHCKCLPGYSGNPYKIDGCTDINECADPKLNQCEEQATCFNTAGSYYCQCPKHFHGTGTKSDHCIPNSNKSISTAYKTTLGVGGGVILLIILASWILWQHEKRQLRKARESFFQQNGGHLLKQKLNGRDVSVDMVKIFTTEELERATNKFSDSNIIGKGGFGAVYKGTLPNQQVIAIKKSLQVDAKQSEQFINEVVLLSQLNNRHVVKLLGCCLETEVPLLVYEYINNGTLHDHLHDEMKASLLTWDNRVRIASEVADVLSYLHSTISTPIIHRDIKSMNILLDKNYTAKVADFGASRLVPMDQKHLATMVLGTYGYLDPEYLQRGELTQKSDVYSFGVVLVEILTRQEAVSHDRPERDRCLAIFFLRKVKEQCLHEILEDRIVKDKAIYEKVKEVANLAQSCLKLTGDERPTMKEVATELQRIRGKTIGSHPWSGSDNVFVGESTQFIGDSSNNQFSSLLASLECGR